MPGIEFSLFLCCEVSPQIWGSLTGNTPGMEKTKLKGLHVLVKKSIRNFER
jgi:hypothetical protein